MATRPELHRAVAKTKSKASEYNDNFDMMMDFVDTSIGESKTYVDNFMPTQSGQNGKFLKTNGTQTSWFDPYADFTQLASSGNIFLLTNSLNYITPSDAVVFTLPEVTDTKLNQILVQVNMEEVHSINVGTTHFFNNKTPDLSTEGLYNLIYEYDKDNEIWVCGWMRKS